VPCGLAALVLASAGCKPPPQEDPRVGRLEREVGELKSELAETNKAKDAQAEEADALRRELSDRKSAAKAEILKLETERDDAVARLDELVKPANSARKPPDIIVAPPPPAAEKFSTATAQALPATSAFMDAVILIEGDESRGTGFLVKQDGKHYLYTAAHVFSGNSRLTASSSSGRKFTKFGALEVAEGADLVRLEVLELPQDPLTLFTIAEPGKVVVGAEILVLGDGGGAGVIAESRGKVVGFSGDSVEVDAAVIQGNSGGPVIDVATGRVIGVVTHLTAKRDDVWAEGTRYGEVRRFACRIDREWKWQPTTIANFLAEAKKIADYDRMTRVGFAISSLNPGVGGLRLDTKLSDSQTALSVLSEAQDVPVVSELIKMNSELTGRGVRYSEADLLKRFRSMLASSITQVNRGAGTFDPSKFSAYHREKGETSLQWREKANVALKSRLESLSR
jgi:S1-C subfamily serine protease